MPLFFDDNRTPNMKMFSEAYIQHHKKDERRIEGTSEIHTAHVLTSEGKRDDLLLLGVGQYYQHGPAPVFSIGLYSSSEVKKNLFEFKKDDYMGAMASLESGVMASPKTSVVIKTLKKLGTSKLANYIIEAIANHFDEGCSESDIRLLNETIKTGCWDQKVPVGTTLRFDCDRQGIWLFVNGGKSGRVEIGDLARALLKAYLSLSPSLKASVMKHCCGNLTL